MKRRGEPSDAKQRPTQRLRQEVGINDSVCLSPTLSVAEVARALRYTHETTGLPSTIDNIIIEMCVSNLRSDTRRLMFDDMLLQQKLEDEGIQTFGKTQVQLLQSWNDPDLVRMLDLCRGSTDLAFDCLQKMAFATVMQEWEDENYTYTCAVEWLSAAQEFAWRDGEYGSPWARYWIHAYNQLIDSDYDHTFITYDAWLGAHSCILQGLINEDYKNNFAGDLPI
jgi:hypothetical protein